MFSAFSPIPQIILGTMIYMLISSLSVELLERNLSDSEAETAFELWDMPGKKVSLEISDIAELSQFKHLFHSGQ